MAVASLLALTAAAGCAATNDHTGSGGSNGSGGGVNFDGGGGGTLGDAACVKTSAAAEALPPVILFVLDTSGSMADPAPGGGPQKWDIVRIVINESIKNLGDTASVGLFYFPNVTQHEWNDLNICLNKQLSVPVAPLDAAQRGAITTSLQGVAPAWGTPTHDAFVFGSQSLASGPLTGNEVIVLMTDGDATNGENCVPNFQLGPLLAAINATTAGGIRTFVLGSPGSETFVISLSEMAEAGGTAKPGCSHLGPDYCHFDMTTQMDLTQALTSALADVVGQTLSCAYPIPAPPDGSTLDPALVNVLFTQGNGTQKDIYKDTGSPCTGGWQYSPDGKQILLCGTACDEVKADSMGKIDILFGCETLIK